MNEEFANLLSELGKQYSFHALLILKDGKTWALKGTLSRSERSEIEAVVQQIARDGHDIDMARFLRLGEKQQKFMLYAVSISGSLVLCTLNFASRPLSQIRNETLEIKHLLPTQEDQIPQIEPFEAQEEVLPPSSQDIVDLETGEAAPTTLDDLLAEPAGGKAAADFKENSG